MQQEVYEQVCYALQLSHSNATGVSERQRAYAYLDAFKREQSLAGLMEYAGGFFQSADAAIQHFGLQLFEWAIAAHWGTTETAQHSHIRTQLLRLLTQLPAQTQLFIKEKLVKLVAEIAKRQFPQRWPDFLPELLSICSRSETQAQLVMMVLRSLAEDCVNSQFNTCLPAARRTDILQGLNACFPTLFPIMYQLAAQQYAIYKNTSSTTEQKQIAIQLIQACFKMLKEFLDWMPVVIPAAEETNFVLVFISVLEDVELRSLACECLGVYLCRTFGRENHSLMISFTQSLLAKVKTIKLEYNQNDPDELVFQKAINMLLVSWGTHQYDLFKQGFDKEQAAHHQILRDYCQILVSLFAHPSLIMAENQLIVWLLLMRSDLVLSNCQFVVDEMWRLVLLKCFKFGNPDLENHPSCFTAIEEFDDAGSWSAAYANFRGKLYGVIARLVVLNPTLGVRLVCEHTENIFKLQLATVTETVHENTPAFVYLEGLTCICDRVFKDVEFRGTGDIEQWTESIVQTFVSWKTMDPLLYYRKALGLSAFTKFYRQKTDVLSLVLEELFASVLFLLPGESIKGNLSGATLNVRRRAISSLVKICQILCETLIPMFNVMCDRVISILPQVRDSETVLLYEMLVCVSNAMPDVSQQSSFLQQIVAEPLNSWNNAEGIRVAISSPQELVTQILSQDGARQPIDDVSKILNTFYGVSKRVESNNKKEDNNAFDVLWSGVVPNLMVFLRTLHAVYHPSITSALLTQPENTVAAGLLYCSADEVSHFFGGKFIEHDNVPSSSCMNPVAAKVMKVSKWQKLIRDLCYQLLGVALSRPVFYQLPNVRSYLNESLLSAVEWMQHSHLKNLFIHVLHPFTSHCPTEQYSTLLGPFLTQLFTHLNSRLEKTWTLDNKEKKTWQVLFMPNMDQMDNAKDEAVQEKVKVDMSLAVLEFMETFLDPKAVVNQSSKDALPKHVTTEKDVVLKKFLLIQQPGLRLLMVDIIVQSLTLWNNATSKRRGIHLCEIVLLIYAEQLKELQESNQFGVEQHALLEVQDLIATKLFPCLCGALMFSNSTGGNMNDSSAAAALRKKEEENVKWEIVNALKNIYCRVSLGLLPVEECKGVDPQRQLELRTHMIRSTKPRDFLVSIGATEELVVQLDKALVEEQSSKSQKNIMKEFIDPIIGYYTGSTRSDSNNSCKKKIEDLPEQLVLIHKIQQQQEKENQQQIMAQDAGIVSQQLFQ